MQNESRHLHGSTGGWLARQRGDCEAIAKKGLEKPMGSDDDMLVRHAEGFGLMSCHVPYA